MQRFMGLNWVIDLGSLTSGMRTMFVMLTYSRSRLPRHASFTMETMASRTNS